MTSSVRNFRRRHLHDLADCHLDAGKGMALVYRRCVLYSVCVRRVCNLWGGDIQNTACEYEFGSYIVIETGRVYSRDDSLGSLV